MTDSPALFDDTTTPADTFDLWWEAYPHKVGKARAREAYAKALRRTDAPTLLAGLRGYIRTKPVEQAWCHPTTWLNQDRWEDVPAIESIPVELTAREAVERAAQRQAAQREADEREREDIAEKRSKLAMTQQVMPHAFDAAVERAAENAPAVIAAHIRNNPTGPVAWSFVWKELREDNHATAQPK